MALAPYKSVAGPRTTSIFCADAGLIGTPWSPEKMSEEIAKLRASLIAPEKRHITRHPPEVPSESTQELWVVAVTGDNFVLFYDPALQEFGLAVQGEAGLPVSIGVYGDLVGTFCSR